MSTAAKDPTIKARRIMVDRETVINIFRPWPRTIGIRPNLGVSSGSWESFRSRYLMIRNAMRAKTMIPTRTARYVNRPNRLLNTTSVLEKAIP